MKKTLQNVTLSSFRYNSSRLFESYQSHRLQTLTLKNKKSRLEFFKEDGSYIALESEIHSNFQALVLEVVLC